MGSVLNLSKLARAEGAPPLQRQVEDNSGKVITIDFWNDVTNLDVEKLEGILSYASTEQEYDLTSFIRAIEYQGFDRAFYIKHCLGKMSISVFARFAILGAVRGSNFKRITETCDNMPQDLIDAFTRCSFVKTPSKRTDITILRCTASIPHWCAFYLNKANVAKKLNALCPAPLQFPGAASLPMSREIRMQHIAFCQAFSMLLPGGRFRLSIYLTAMSNLIPVADIPAPVLAILNVSSSSESYKLTDDELNTLNSAVATTK